MLVKSFFRRKASIIILVFLLICIFLLGDSLKSSAQILAVGLLVIIADRMYYRRLDRSISSQNVRLIRDFSHLKQRESARATEFESLQDTLIRGVADLKNDHATIMLSIRNHEASRAKAASFELKRINGNHSAVMLGIRNHEASRAKAARMELERINRTYASVSSIINMVHESTSKDDPVLRQLVRLYSEVNGHLIESAVALDSIHHRIELMQKGQ